jgi:hypothetical protein
MSFIFYIEDHKITIRCYTEGAHVTVRSKENLIGRHMLTNNLCTFTHYGNSWHQLKELSGFNEFVSLIFIPSYNSNSNIILPNDPIKSFVIRAIAEVLKVHINKDSTAWLPDSSTCRIHVILSTQKYLSTPRPLILGTPSIHFTTIPSTPSSTPVFNPMSISHELEKKPGKMITYHRSMVLECDIPTLNDFEAFDTRKFFTAWLQSSSKSFQIPIIGKVNTDYVQEPSIKVTFVQNNTSSLPDQKFLIFAAPSPFKKMKHI